MSSELLASVDSAELNDVQETAICYDEIEEGEVREVRKLPCGHIFDLDCTVKWFEEKWGGDTKCSMCRRKYNLVEGRKRSQKQGRPATGQHNALGEEKRLGTVHLALQIFINIKLRLFSVSLISLFCLLQLSLFRLHAFSNYHHMVVYCFILTFACPVFDYTS